MLKFWGLQGSVTGGSLLGTLELAPSPLGNSGLQLYCAPPPTTHTSSSSPLRLLVILEAEIGSQKVPLRTPTPRPVIPACREGPQSGH